MLHITVEPFNLFNEHIHVLLLIFYELCVYR